VYRWRLAYFSLVLGDKKDRIDLSRYWCNEWPLHSWVDCRIFRWLRDTVPRMLVERPAKYPEPDEDEASNEGLPHKAESNMNAVPCAPPPQKALLFCPLPGHDPHLKCCLTMVFGDNLDIYYRYSEMGNDKCTEMQLKFQDLPNPSVFVTTPKVGGTGLNFTAANHALITQKCCVLNEQHQVFARIVRLWQNRVPHTWLLNTGSSGYDNRASHLHQLCGVAQMKVQHGLMSRLNITTSIIYRIQECHEDHTKLLMEERDVVLSHGKDE
jgi:hypothetical protein